MPFYFQQGEELEADNDEDEAKASAGKEAFLNLAGADGEIDAYELKEILNATFTQGTCTKCIYQFFGIKASCWAVFSQHKIHYCQAQYMPFLLYRPNSKWLHNESMHYFYISGSVSLTPDKQLICD